MPEGQGKSNNILIAILAWIATFVASSLLITAITGASGLGLVWGVFAALAVFQFARHSFWVSILVILASLFVVLLRGIYLLVI